jgi:hypothetical protein
MARDKIKFEANIPVELSLAYPQGKIVDGQFGQQTMYGLCFPDNHVMFLDLAVSQKLNVLQLQPGEHFVICKRPKNGSTPARWDVWLTPATEQMRAQRERPSSRPASPEPPSHLERQLAASIHEAQQRRPPQSAPAPQPGPVMVPPVNGAPAWQSVLIAKADVLIDAYAACLEHASKHGNRVEPGDVRSLLQTVYIAMTKNGVNSNAA